MGCEARRAAGARHRMPLVAHAPGIESEGIVGIGCVDRRAWGSCDHARFAAGRKKTAACEHALDRPFRSDRPLGWTQRVVVGADQAGEVEIARTLVLEIGESDMLGENLGWARVIEGRAQTLCDLRHDPPVGLCRTGCRQKRTLAGNAPLGIRDRTVLLAPAEGRQFYMRVGERVGIGNAIRNDDEFAARQSARNTVGVGQARRRVRRHDPYGLDLAALDGGKKLDGFEAGLGRDMRGAPETRDAIDVGGCEIHVGSKLICKCTHFAPAHRIGLARHRERPHPWPPDTAGRKMAIDDRVDLVDPRCRLVHTLRIDGHDLLRPRKIRIEGLQAGTRQSAKPSCCVDVGAGLGHACCMAGDIGVIDGTGRDQICEKPVEEGNVRSHCQRQMQIGAFGRRRAARIDDHEPRQAAALGACGKYALVENRMAPGEV